MIRKIGFAALVLFVMWSCRYDYDENSYSGVIIKTGTICGWCSINDTLSIRGNSVRYVNYVQCNKVTPSVVKTDELKAGELDALLSKLSFAELKKLDLNSCNVCFDGCDDWISFDNGTESHYIRFSANDPKLKPIQAFVDQLNEIKGRYNKGN